MLSASENRSMYCRLAKFMLSDEYSEIKWIRWYGVYISVLSELH